MNKRQAGRLGGLALFAKRGIAYMRKIGRKGGLAFAARYALPGYGGMYSRPNWKESVTDAQFDQLRDDEGTRIRRETNIHEWRTRNRKGKK